MSAVSMAV